LAPHQLLRKVEQKCLAPHQHQLFRKVEQNGLAPPFLKVEKVDKKLKPKLLFLESNKLTT